MTIFQGDLGAECSESEAEAIGIVQRLGKRVEYENFEANNLSPEPPLLKCLHGG